MPEKTEQEHEEDDLQEISGTEVQKTYDVPDIPQNSVKKQPSARNVNMRSMPRVQQPRQEQSISGFLKGLFPQNLDAEDLMVVLLLLLMSGQGNDDQNSALMTLGIYLFL